MADPIDAGPCPVCGGPSTCRWIVEGVKYEVSCDDPECGARATFRVDEQ